MLGQGGKCRGGKGGVLAVPCVHVNIGGTAVLLNVAGPTRIIHAAGKDYLFEFHEYLGPMMLGKRGQLIDSFPPKQSPFWDALHWWLKQGRRMDGNRCIFEWQMKLVDITTDIGRNRIVLTGGPSSPRVKELIAQHAARMEGRI